MVVVVVVVDLVPTTVAEMSLDSDDNEERKGGAQVNSSTINTELNVTVSTPHSYSLFKC